MSHQIDACFQQLDRLLLAYLADSPPERTPHSDTADPGSFLNKMYVHFWGELVNNSLYGEISPGQASRIEEKLAQRLELSRVREVADGRKRGRPLKWSQGELRLALWLKSQSRTRFTKRELSLKYRALSGSPRRSLSSRTLARILHNHKLYNIDIVNPKRGHSRHSMFPAQGAPLEQQLTSQEGSAEGDDGGWLCLGVDSAGSESGELERVIKMEPEQIERENCREDESGIFGYGRGGTGYTNGDVYYQQQQQQQ